MSSDTEREHHRKIGIAASKRGAEDMATWRELGATPAEQVAALREAGLPVVLETPAMASEPREAMARAPDVSDWSKPAASVERLLAQIEKQQTKTADMWARMDATETEWQALTERFLEWNEARMLANMGEPLTVSQAEWDMVGHRFGATDEQMAKREGSMLFGVAVVVEP